MEIKIEGKRLRRIWLDSVELEADMAAPEIDREDVHNRKKMEMKCYKKEAQPYRKTD